MLGLTTIPKIMAYDHNYTDPWSSPAGQVTGYPEAVINQSGGGCSSATSSSGPVSMIGFHHYQSTLSQEQEALDGQAPSSPVGEHTAYPCIPIWATEATGTYGSSTIDQNLVWEGQHDLMEPLQNWASASLYLNLALDAAGGPHDGGCGSTGSDPAACRGMITLTSSGPPILHEDYYDWAQFSKFIHPGATHVCSDTITLPSTVNTCTTANPSAPTDESNMIDTVAFQNLDGSIVLVAMNTTPDPVGPYESAVEADHPISYWPLTDPAGTPTAADIAGSDPGTLEGGVTAGVPGPIASQTAMAFDGGNCSGVDLSNGSGGLAPAQSLTLEAWLKTTEPSPQIAFRWRYYGYGLFGGSNTTLDSEQANGIDNTTSAPTAIDDGNWHYVVVTVSPEGTRLFIDGKLAASSSYATLYYQNGGGVAIGRDGNACDGLNPSWDGGIGQVAVYGYALTAKQIAAHYTAATS